MKAHEEEEKGGTKKKETKMSFSFSFLPFNIKLCIWILCKYVPLTLQMTCEERSETFPFLFYSHSLSFFPPLPLLPLLMLLLSVHSVSNAPFADNNIHTKRKNEEKRKRTLWTWKSNSQLEWSVGAFYFG